MGGKQTDYHKLNLHLVQFINCSYQEYRLLFEYLDDVFKNLKTYKKHLLVAKIAILHDMYSKVLSTDAEMREALLILQFSEQQSNPAVMQGQHYPLS